MVAKQSYSPTSPSTSPAASRPQPPIILDLCGGTGSWSRPYAEAGYDVRVITLPEQDVRDYMPPAGVHGILAAPPCTEFAVSGARWWASKPAELLEEALEVVQSCLDVIEQAQPVWWALENPVGRLPKWIGRYNYTFQPWEYGDPWVKRTCIWGTAKQPEKCPVCLPKNRPEYGHRNRDIRWNSGRKTVAPEDLMQMAQMGMLPSDWVHRLGPSPERATLRSLTPQGFARAFFKANP